MVYLKHDNYIVEIHHSGRKKPRYTVEIHHSGLKPSIRRSHKPRLLAGEEETEEQEDLLTSSRSVSGLYSFYMLTSSPFGYAE